MANQTYNLFVGADNETGFLDIDRISGIVGKSHDFTLTRGIGSWHGDREDSVIITVTDETDIILETVKLLKIEMNQDAIGIQRIPNIEFI